MALEDNIEEMAIWMGEIGAPEFGIDHDFFYGIVWRYVFVL